MMNRPHNAFLSELLDASVAAAGEQPFIRSDNTRLSYREFDAEVTACSSRLSSLGVREGERVLIVNKTVMDSTILTFACAKLQCIFVIVDANVSMATFDYIIDDCLPALIVCERALGPDYQAVFTSPSGDVWWCSDERDLSIAKNDTVCIMYTSGSTGKPKGVAMSNGNLRFVLGAIQERLAYQPDDVVACYLPLSFDYGLYQVFLACQALACIALRSPAPTSALLVNAIKQDQVSVLPLVPSLWEVMVYQFRVRPHVCRALELRIITSTGQTLQPQLIDEMKGFLPNAKLFPMYGLTECKRVSILLPHEYLSKKGSVGRPLSNTHVWVCDERGTSLAAGEVGELVVAGDHVATYWARGSDVDDGLVFRTVGTQRRLHTGDYGYIDRDGFIFLEGRRDMLIKRRAYRISLTEIESSIYKLPFIESAAVIWDDSRELLIAFIVLYSPQDKLLDQIHKLLQQHLEVHKLPDHYVLIDSLPLTINAKVSRIALRELWLKRTQ